MKHLKIKHYVTLLYKEGTSWEQRGLLSTEQNTSTKRITLKRVVFLCLCIILSCFLKTGFNDAFLGYTISGLSIFIGLFINIIIVLYQKFLVITTAAADDRPNDNESANKNKMKDFIKQFTFVTGKNLLIATFLIILSSIYLLYKDFFSIDTSNYSIVLRIEQLTKKDVLNFFVYSILQVTRVLILYLLIDFFFLLLYSIGSLFAFLKGEYKK